MNAGDNKLAENGAKIGDKILAMIVELDARLGEARKCQRRPKSLSRGNAGRNRVRERKGDCAKSGNNPVHKTVVSMKTGCPKLRGAQLSLLKLLAAAVGLTNAMDMTDGDRRSAEHGRPGTQSPERGGGLCSAAQLRRACAGQRLGLMAKPAQQLIIL